MSEPDADLLHRVAGAIQNGLYNHGGIDPGTAACHTAASAVLEVLPGSVTEDQEARLDKGPCLACGLPIVTCLRMCMQTDRSCCSECAHDAAGSVTDNRRCDWSAKWIVEPSVRCVVCPDCAFTFDAFHADTPEGGYSCPCCNELALRQAIERAGLEGHPMLVDVLRRAK